LAAALFLPWRMSQKQRRKKEEEEEKKKRALTDALNGS
jgi:hypothetical protein